MSRIKMLKDVGPYSLNGLGGELLYAKKGEVVEVPDKHAAGIIRSGYAKSTKQAPPEKEPEDKGSNNKFGLNKDNKAFILAMGKEEIETVLRLYGIEIDRRHSLEAIRKTLIESVSQDMPDGVDGKEELATFYAAVLSVDLDLEAYVDSNPTMMAASMGEILTEALKGEDS